MTPFSILLVGLTALGPAIKTMVHAATDIQGAQPFSRTPNVPNASAFNGTCTVGSYLFNATSNALGMYCNTDDTAAYSYDWSSIDLNLCIANYNGTLVPSPGGNFSDSCDACNITWRHVYLPPMTSDYTTTPHAWVTRTVVAVRTPRWDDLYLRCGGCSNGGYATPTATISLNDVMTNENGTLGCHDFRGSTVHARPDPARAGAAKRTAVPRPDC